MPAQAPVRAVGGGEGGGGLFSTLADDGAWSLEPCSPAQGLSEIEFANHAGGSVQFGSRGGELFPPPPRSMGSRVEASSVVTCSETPDE